MSRIARIAPRPRSQDFLTLIAGAGIILAVGLGIVLPAALSLAGV